LAMLVRSVGGALEEAAQAAMLLRLLALALVLLGLVLVPLGLVLVLVLFALGQLLGLDGDEARAEIGVVAPLAHPGAAHAPEEEREAADEAPVADAVDDEGLHPRGGLLVVLVPEADEQVAAEADALPAEEHHDEVVPEDEEQHREDEEVQVREEA